MQMFNPSQNGHPTHVRNQPNHPDSASDLPTACFFKLPEKSGAQTISTGGIPSERMPTTSKESPQKSSHFNFRKLGNIFGFIGIVAASWLAVDTIKNFITKKRAPTGAASTELNSVEPETSVVSKETLLKQFDEEADLAKVAFAHVDSGLIRYEVPWASNSHNSVHVQWFDRGSEHDQFVQALSERGVTIKPGASRLSEKAREDANEQAERARKLMLEGKSVERWDFILKTCGFGLLTGLSLVMLSRAIIRLRFGKGFGGFPGDISGDEMDTRPKEGFSHVGGVEQVIGELTFLRDEIVLVTRGDTELQLPKGLLFYGPPGTGKTMLARALAAETDCPFVSFKGSDLSPELFVGTGVRKIRSAFAQARQLRDQHTEELREKTGNPNARGVCIIFIDEFDSIASRRQPTNPRSSSEDTRVVNMLLTELDNIHKDDESGLGNKDILVVAATNDRENLDSAVIRNGRFNRQIKIPSPRSRIARLDILTKATINTLESKGWTVQDRDTSLERLARMAVNSSGADLVGVLEKAQALSRRRSSDKVITFEDIMEGFQQQSFGFKMSSMVLPEERRKTAYHELVGHGVMAWACEIAIFLISMEPRGESLGRVIPDPEALSEIAPTKQQLLQRILVNVAGQVAERLRYGELGATVGNTADLESTRRLLKLLISTGLLGEDIATSLLEQRQGAEHELSTSQKLLINRAYARAVQTVQSILAALTNEEWDHIVDECLQLNKELVGDEAQAFLEKHLGNNETLGARVRQALDAYYGDPLGNNPSRSESDS